MPWRAHIAYSILALLTAWQLVYFSLSCAAQNNYGATTDSTYIYLEEAQNVSRSQPVQAITWIHEAIRYSIAHNNFNGQADAYLQLAQLQLSQGRDAQAEENFRKCKNLFGVEGRSAQDKSLYSTPSRATNTNAFIRATISLANLYENRGSWLIALAELADARAQAESMGAVETVRETDRGRARILSKSGDYKAAAELLNKILSEEQAAADQKGACETRIELGHHYMRLGELDKARKYFEEASSMAGTYGMNEQYVRSNNELAAIYNRQGNVAGELKTRNDIVTLSNTMDDAQNMYIQNLAIGNTYIATNDLSAAEEKIEESIGYLTHTGSLAITKGTSTDHPVQPEIRSSHLQLGADAYRNLAEGFLKQRDYDKSIEYYKKYSIMQDSVNIVHAREMAEALQISNVLGESQQRIALLEKEQLLTQQTLALLQQEKEISQKQLFNRNLLIGVLVAGLLSIVIAAWLIMRNVRSRRRSDKLLALQSMSGQMNPHFIFNALNSVNEFISRNDERSANRYMTSFSRLMRRVLDDSSHIFISVQEEIAMLKLYLELEHARFSDQFDYTLDIDPELEHIDFQIPPMMVQPYIENAVWHGLRYRKTKGQLSVSFRRKEDQLVIEVLDNGIGVDRSRDMKTHHQKKQKSLGMRNIAQRIALMNELYSIGLEVTIEPGSNDAENPGTRVEIVAPQKKEIT